MLTFLHIVAEDLYSRFNGHFENLTVVFPNKRASLFFDQQLFDIVGHPIWAPRYMTISELFQSFSPLTLADPIQLVCMLYQAYLQTGDGQTDESLDQFWSWGELMLSDFDDIDSNLVDAQKLFTNISDIDDLTRLDYLTEEQVEAIRHYFPDFREPTELKQRFLSIWKRLLPTYERFREMLLQENIAYEGMMKKKVIEEILLSTLNSQLSTFVFVGFNVLNETERKLFKFLKENAEALSYWDYDNFYLGERGWESFEAGRFIRQNIETFGNALPDPDIYNNFSQEKHIHLISSPTENAQARHAGSLLEELTNSKTQKLTDTAIVLCDETLLQPVLHAIPQETELNVTMGFPLSGTLISSLLLELLELQLHGKASGNGWRYSHVVSMLRHPYVGMMTEGRNLELMQRLQDENILFPQRSHFEGDDFLLTLFTPQTSVGEQLNWLLDITERIGKGVTDATPLDEASLFTAYTLLNRLQRIDEQGLLQIEPVTLRRLLLQLIKGRTIPFHGEPAVGLQVMGILETRNLDFRNVIMLSVGEGNLPKRNQLSSFIPYNLREAYGLTTVERQNSLYAYYFYRLLQRAENIYLHYNSSPDSNCRGEMSRFLMQLMLNMPVQQETLSSGNVTPQPLLHPVNVNKTPDVLLRLHERFAAPHILSPSAINSYLNCPLQFYLSYVAQLNPVDDLSEEVGNDVFGNIFHYCMENLYRETLGLKHDLQANELLSLAQNEAFIERLVDRAFNIKFFHLSEAESQRTPHYNGEQLLNRQALITYVQNQLRYDAQLCPMTVWAVEAPIAGQEGNIHLGGIIDRIDLVTIDGHRQLRIVDYKTSSSAKPASSIEELFNPSNTKRASYVLQAFYYADLYTTEQRRKSDEQKEVVVPDESVAPALMYVKLSRSTDPMKVIPPLLSISTLRGEKEVCITDFAKQCKAEFHEQLQQCISDIFDPAIAFTQSQTETPCQWCDFAALCGRQKDKK